MIEEIALTIRINVFISTCDEPELLWRVASDAPCVPPSSALAICNGAKSPDIAITKAVVIKVVLILFMKTSGESRNQNAGIELQPYLLWGVDRQKSNI
ncbi:MAG TPA: hypothetical protein VFC63_12740 [Blastocatellia bacterium]|nr:hypothetical protein [Blastocatellia bacterium]